MGPTTQPRTDLDRSNRFDAYAVRTRSGPHVTVQAGVEHAGRYWTTTAASSLKVRSVREHGVAAAVVDHPAGRRAVGGTTTALRLGSIEGVVDDPVAVLRSACALVRLGATSVEQLVGYLEAVGEVPARWWPHRRALLVTRIDRSLVLDGDVVVAADGTWATPGPAPVPTVGPPPRPLPVDQVPEAHRGALGAGAHVGLATPTGPVALPATWLGGARLGVSTGAVAAVRALLPGPASVAFDDSDRRRPDEKRGVVFRGTAGVRRVDGDRTVLTVDTERITTWDGFAADTVAAS